MLITFVGLVSASRRAFLFLFPHVAPSYPRPTAALPSWRRYAAGSPTSSIADPSTTRTRRYTAASQRTTAFTALRRSTRTVVSSRSGGRG